jgi:hypothetical protein
MGRTAGLAGEVRRVHEDQPPLVAVLTESSVVYVPTREAIYGIAEPLVERAREAGHFRAGLNADDLMRLIFAATGGMHRWDSQRRRALQIVLDGSAQPRATPETSEPEGQLEVPVRFASRALATNPSTSRDDRPRSHPRCTSVGGRSVTGTNRTSARR